MIKWFHLIQLKERVNITKQIVKKKLPKLIYYMKKNEAKSKPAGQYIFHQTKPHRDLQSRVVFSPLWPSSLPPHSRSGPLDPFLGPPPTTSDGRAHLSIEACLRPASYVCLPHEREWTTFWLWWQARALLSCACFWCGLMCCAPARSIPSNQSNMRYIFSSLTLLAVETGAGAWACPSTSFSAEDEPPSPKSYPAEIHGTCFACLSRLLFSVGRRRRLHPCMLDWMKARCLIYS